MDFVNKSILIISPEKWGINKVSKHHYAITLAHNNRVYFLNPPSMVRGIFASDSGYENLTILDYNRSFAGINHLLFFRPLFTLLNQYEIQRLQKFCGSFDIVWSFDPFRFQILSLFRAQLTIFHCVDFAHTKLDLFCAQTADLVLSVAQPILDKYQSLNRPTYLINHGVSSVFFNTKKRNVHNKRLQCGYVGNLISFGIDHETLIKIIQQNTEIEFYFIGPHNASNLGSLFETQNLFIEQLKSFNHVKLLGQMPPHAVAEIIQTFDLFLICYHTEKIGPIVSNNHKLLEYLSTGKVVVSSYISTYNEIAPPLFEMVKHRNELPIRFREVIRNLENYNRLELQEKRLKFALANSYENHVRKIELLAQNF